MDYIRTTGGALLGAVFNLLVLRLFPYIPDLTDWGGKSYPRAFITPLLILALAGYAGGWIGAKLSPVMGRLTGMLVSILTAGVIIGWQFSSNVLDPLFHHPAYPAFSDQALLALAVLLVAGHLGGARVEKSAVDVSDSGNTVGATAGLPG